MEAQLKRLRELRRPVPVEGLPLETQQLIQLLGLHVDYQNLHQTKNTISVYDETRRQFAVYRALDFYILQLETAGVKCGVLTENSAANTNAKMDFYLGEVYGVHLTAGEAQEGQFNLRDKCQQYSQSLNRLDKTLSGFGAKKQRLYLHFQKYLLCIYLGIYRRLYDFAYTLFSTCNYLPLGQDSRNGGVRALQSHLLAQAGRVVVRQSERDVGDRILDNAGQLYMYLLFEQALFKKSGLDEVLDTLEAQQRELDELRQAAATFSDSLRLFDTADFYVAQDDGSQTNTELDYVLRYCQQYLTLKTRMWTEFKDMQRFIRDELSLPFIVQESASGVVARAELMSERLSDI